jgi:DNA-binding FadR family transcriptional regulator
VSLTNRAIVRIRELILTGELKPGSRLPPDQQLAAGLGLGRNLIREAVKALVVADVLEVRLRRHRQPDVVDVAGWRVESDAAGPGVAGAGRRQRRGPDSGRA